MKSQKATLWNNSTLTLLIKLAGSLLIAISISLFVLGLYTDSHRLFKGIFKNIGSIAEYTAIAAGALWLLRNVWIKLNKVYKSAITDFLRSLFMFMKKHHTFLGWITFSLAASHGAFFLIKDFEVSAQVISGIGTMFFLVILVIIGLILDKASKKKYKSNKRIHQVIATIFGLALVVHLLL